jgi:hypothetical protein
LIEEEEIEEEEVEEAFREKEGPKAEVVQEEEEIEHDKIMCFI